MPRTMDFVFSEWRQQSLSRELQPNLTEWRPAVFVVITTCAWLTVSAPIALRPGVVENLLAPGSWATKAWDRSG